MSNSNKPKQFFNLRDLLTSTQRVVTTTLFDKTISKDLFSTSFSQTKTSTIITSRSHQKTSTQTTQTTLKKQTSFKAVTKAKTTTSMSTDFSTRLFPINKTHQNIEGFNVGQNESSGLVFVNISSLISTLIFSNTLLLNKIESSAYNTTLINSDRYFLTDKSLIFLSIILLFSFVFGVLLIFGFFFVIVKTNSIFLEQKDETEFSKDKNFIFLSSLELKHQESLVSDDLSDSCSVINIKNELIKKVKLDEFDSKTVKMSLTELRKLDCK